MEKVFRNKWFELTWPSRSSHWTLSYNVPSDNHDSWAWDNNRSKGDRAIHRAWLTIGIWKMFFMVYLWKIKPFKDTFESDSTKRYGFTFFERGLHLHWGDTKVYWLPWDWEIVRWDLLLPGGEIYYRNKYPKPKGVRSYSWYTILEVGETPFKDAAQDVQVQVAETINLEHYTKDGRKQVAKIRLAGEEREWRWRWFKWLPWPNQKKRSIDCSSDIELGEKAGSWKGGMMGWSIPWPEDESMKQAFHNWYRKWDGR